MADDRSVEVRPILVGRESERQALRAVIERAVSGEPGMLLLHGEAGIGKTSLVREAAGVAGDEGLHVLFGQCLRFGANVTSYVPFMQAFTQWLRTTGSECRDRLAPHGTVDDLVPALNDSSGGLVLLQIGTAVDAIQADGATVLVVDDLQWSDPSSLDALSYLVAGFNRRAEAGHRRHLSRHRPRRRPPLARLVGRRPADAVGVPGRAGADGRVDHGGDGPGSRRPGKRHGLGGGRSTALGRKPLPGRPSDWRGPKHRSRASIP